MRRLPQSFFARDSVVVARDLLGRYLARGRVILRITEVEAYRPDNDSASHSRFGRTERNAPMWGPPGRVYVYLCYGLHQMLNIVTNPNGEPAAVLIRACEPIAGLGTIRSRRGGKDGPVLLTGPGKVGAALALDRSWSHHALYRPGGLELRRGQPPDRVLVGPRVGVDYAEPAHRDALWRFAVSGTKWITAPKTLRAASTRSGRAHQLGSSGTP